MWASDDSNGSVASQDSTNPTELTEKLVRFQFLLVRPPDPTQLNALNSQMSSLVDIGNNLRSEKEEERLKECTDCVPSGEEASM